LSIGISILLPDGEHLIFASRGSGDEEREERPWEITTDNIQKWASCAWSTSDLKIFRDGGYVCSQLVKRQECPI